MVGDRSGRSALSPSWSPCSPTTPERCASFGVVLVHGDGRGRVGFGIEHDATINCFGDGMVTAGAIVLLVHCRHQGTKGGDGCLEFARGESE